MRPSRRGPASSETVAFGTPTNLIFGPLAPVWETFSRLEANSSNLFHLSGFAQDTWHLNPRLSLTFALGVSLPRSPNVSPASDLYSVDDSTASPQITPIFTSQRVWQRPLQFQPAVSAAWRISGSTMLRASWALAYDNGSAAALDQLNGIPYQQLRTPTGSSVESYDPSNLASVQLGYGYSRNLRLPIYQRWNVALHHDWRHRDAVEVSYAGLSGHRELRREIMVDPPFAGWIDLRLQ